MTNDGKIIWGDIYYTNPSTTYIWNQQDGIQSLDAITGSTFYVNGMSLNGEVIVGSNRNEHGNTTAVYWSSQDGYQELDHPITELGSSGATSVSADGKVLAGNYTSGDGRELFRWTALSGIEGLGWLGISDTYSDLATPYDLSADGSVIVGRSTDASGETHAFRWTQASGMVKLDVSDLSSHSSRAYDTSSDGTIVVGDARSDSYSYDQAFLWDQTEGMTGLGFLPVEAFGYLSTDTNVSIADSHARGVTDDGTMVFGYSRIRVYVGGSFEPYQYTGMPFIWTPSEGMRPAVEVLTQDYGVDLSLLSSFGGIEAISSDGTVLSGNGTDINGKKVGWVITIPEPTSMTVLTTMIVVILSKR